MLQRSNTVNADMSSLHPPTTGTAALIFDARTDIDPNKDYGTPAPTNDPTALSELISLRIDGKEVRVPAGTSVLRAAVMAGINIPKLCATDSLEAFGSCRLCLVQIEGRRGYPASFTTPVEAGMAVNSQN